jgi:hypothetical protein
MSRLIDYTNKSILSSNVTTRLFKLLPINTELSVDYTIRFVNAISSVTTTAFRLNNDSKDYYFDDDGKGTLVRYHYNNNKRVDDDTQFGSVNYADGTITIPQVAFSLLTNSCRIYAQHQRPDVDSVRNQILTVLEDDVTIKTRIDTRKSLIR